MDSSRQLGRDNLISYRLQRKVFFCQFIHDWVGGEVIKEIKDPFSQKEDFGTQVNENKYHPFIRAYSPTNYYSDAVITDRHLAPS